MNRSEQRDHIFKIIFSYDFDINMDINQHAIEYINNIEEENIIKEKIKEHIIKKSTDIIINKDIIDTIISDNTVNWTIDRMNKVDISILRLATYEILYDVDIPVKVAINEAVELAKEYGGETSSSFVNGVIGNIINKNNKDEVNG